MPNARKAEILEGPDFAAHDLHPLSIEFSHGKAIKALVISEAIILQEPKCLLFADEETANAIGTVMNASGIAVPRVRRRPMQREWLHALLCSTVAGASPTRRITTMARFVSTSYPTGR
jgi:hypothetical protein